jgi:AcrR family transcriptional regulator
MPRPRFNKLPIEKKERILEAAAREFGAYGYEGASLNRILEQAGISKGAAYYYFDDKPDLFLTVISSYAEDLVLTIKVDVATLERETFWTTLVQIYHQAYASIFERPWIFQAKKAGGNFLESAHSDERLRQLFEELYPWILSIIKRGQALGLIRSDLPEDLLIGLLMGLDDAHDRWMMAHWQEFDISDLDRLAQQMVNLLKTLFTPN